MSQWNQEKLLVEQYSNDDRLATRIRTHQLYTEPDVSLVDWVLDHVSWRGDETVLDIGCGTGVYLDSAENRAQHIFAGDQSLGMLRTHDTSHNRVNLDAQQLPYPDHVADVILANHMLYHVPDIGQAAAEFARVLKPGRTLLAATNSSRDRQEFYWLMRQIAPAADVENYASPNELPFTLENGAAQLEPHFAEVTMHKFNSWFVFPDPQPVIDYFSTNHERWMGLVADDITWEEICDRIRQILTAHIAEHGEFRVDKGTGVFVCRTAV